jgi:hypothetical protein
MPTTLSLRRCRHVERRKAVACPGARANHREHVLHLLVYINCLVSLNSIPSREAVTVHITKAENEPKTGRRIPKNKGGARMPVRE